MPKWLRLTAWRRSRGGGGGEIDRRGDSTQGQDETRRGQGIS